MGTPKQLPPASEKNIRMATMPGHTNVERSMIMFQFRKLAREVRCGVELVQEAFEELRRLVEIEGLEARWFESELRFEGFVVGRRAVSPKTFLVSTRHCGVSVRITGKLNITNIVRNTA